jgi:diguanylate cyclase (GGDEF)-like protein/PAS domain S-box-containing protein
MAQNPQTHGGSVDAMPGSVHAPLTLENPPPPLGLLLGHPSVTSSPPSISNAAYENHLVEVRLGIASSLFAAIRHKHAPTAAHSLRVALGCSSWAFVYGLPPEQRDELEVAALLHDIGKIGAPDRLLFKPEALARDEVQLVDQYRRTGLNILVNCCDSAGVLEIIRHSGGWYNGTRSAYSLVGDEIPLGARMLAIVDAFDSMTSDQVYRRAMPRERALNELFRHAGTQFDPQLVKAFSELQITAQLHRKVVSHWLQTLDAAQSNRFWRGVTSPAPPGPQAASVEALFQQKLLENMYDAVIFVDSSMRIMLWNRAAERLTGIAASSVIERTWSPTLVGMRDETLAGWATCECPVAYAIGSGVQSLRRLLVANRNNRPVAVDVHTVPVVGTDGFTRGAAMILHDASGEASLEERCQALQERATKDPLTEVANRAEFDRAHKLFVNAHLDRAIPCSTIICDIDHFKAINDTYGHQAGDEVLKNFAQLLKSECRPGDLVSRYGGEEFVVLCADCTNAAAARRAEELRKMIAELPQSALNGKEITVSFGVTEIQAGDSPDSMLRRADRALLEAKRMGRNMVVQLGGGMADDAQLPAEASVQNRPGNELFVERLLVTAVPLTMAVEKLRGFVLDHHAEILAINADRIDLQIEAVQLDPSRRRSDRPIPFLVELTLSEQHVPSTSIDGRITSEVARTQAKVAIRLKRARDRKRANVAAQAQAILAGIQSYLMATVEPPPAGQVKTRRAMNILAPWLKLRR